MTQAGPDTVAASSWGPVYPTTITKGDVILAAADRAGERVERVYGYNTTPDHNNRQCIDLMHYGDTKMRDWLVRYLIANEAVLGVEGIISNRQVMGFPSNGTWYRGPEGTWRPYSGPSPHTDHVHVQVNVAAVRGGVSVPAAPKPKPKPKDAAWSGDLWVVKKVDAWDGSGRRRPELDLAAGQKLAGTIDENHFDDGRYFRVGKVPHRVWYPLDNGNWSHEKGGHPISEGGRSLVKLADLSDLVRAAKQDPGRKQGGTTAGAKDDVLVVEDALRRAGLLSKRYAGDGSFGSSSIAAYAKWQKRLGYRGRDADGIPGADSLRKLGLKYGFDVQK